MRFHYLLKVPWVLAGTFGSLHGATLTPTKESSAAGLLIAGVVLIGIGRFRLRKR